MKFMVLTAKSKLKAHIVSYCCITLFLAKMSFSWSLTHLHWNYFDASYFKCIFCKKFQKQVSSFKAHNGHSFNTVTFSSSSFNKVSSKFMHRLSKFTKLSKDTYVI